MTQNPHVLIANVFFAPNTYGGATIVAEEVARALMRRHGWRVSVLSAMSRAELAPYALQKVECDGITNYLINMPPGRSYAEAYDNPNVTEIATSLLRVLKPDLMHLHCLQELGVGLIGSARQQGIPLVLSTHDFWWLCERQFMIRMDGSYCGQNPIRPEACRGCVSNMAQSRSRFERLATAAAQADLITFPSQFAHDLCQRSGLGAARMKVWENGVHLPGPGFHARQDARRQADGRHVFGFVGGPGHIKGWPLIKAAFGGLKRDDFIVKLVDGGLWESWWEKEDLSDLPGDWEIVPRYDQTTIDAFYAGIDTLLFLSQWKETFGLTVREAICRGVDLIQTDSGGTTEHPLATPERLLKIGCRPEALRQRIEATLSAPGSHPAPAKVRSFATQADELVSFWQQIRDNGHRAASPALTRPAHLHAVGS